MIYKQDIYCAFRGRGCERPPAKFLDIITQKGAILRPLYAIFSLFPFPVVIIFAFFPQRLFPPLAFCMGKDFFDRQYFRF